MKTPFATRLAAACASVGSTFVLLWLVASLAGPSAEAPVQAAQAAPPAPVVVAAVDR